MHVVNDSAGFYGTTIARLPERASLLGVHVHHDAERLLTWGETVDLDVPAAGRQTSSAQIGSPDDAQRQTTERFEVRRRLLTARGPATRWVS